MNGASWDEHTFDSIMRLFRVRTGLVVRPEQRENAKRGIERAMARSKLADAAKYARLLEFDVEALDNLIVELTVGETYFYREPHHFEYICGNIFPEILARRGAQHTIRIWSAACASGEEPYSLAMLCDQQGLARQCSILATDISSEALKKARRAAYREWSMRADGRISARKYLHHDGQEYQVDPRIRRMVNFEFLNLALDVYPSFATGTKALDLILCRNVMIYFDQDTVKAMAKRLFDSLCEGGWLITASGDPSLADFANFDLVVSDRGVFYRRPIPRVLALDAAPPQPSDVAENGQSVWPDHLMIDQPTSRDNDPEPAELTDHAVTQRLSLSEAHAALARGDYQLAVEFTENILADPAACVIHIKALANIDTQQAVLCCESLADRHSLTPDLHFLHAILLMELNLDVEAVQAIQRVVFLDRSLAIGHFLLGSILQRRGALEGARRAFRNARNLCQNDAPDELVPLSDNETAGELARVAEIQLATIEAALRSDP